MPIVRANPNQYLLAGRGGKLENRGSAVQAYLLPGTVYVLVPSIKQEAAFEFTQETKDGIPLRFKGIVIYRITDPIAAARLFDFNGNGGAQQIGALLAHVCLGELRDAVSHMTMGECIEQRKTTLSGVVRAALDASTHTDGGANDWGITVEVAQVAQVFIVDSGLREQLEAEVRNEIKLRSDQSGIRTVEEARLAEMASQSRLAEQKLTTDREDLRRREELLQAEMDAEQQRIDVETPVRLQRIQREAEVLREELAMRELKNRVHASEVEHDLLLPRAQQELRREILPLEQAPAIVESASRVLRGTNLSLYGDHAELVGQLAPILEVVGRAVRQSTAASGPMPANQAGAG